MEISCVHLCLCICLMFSSLKGEEGLTQREEGKGRPRRVFQTIVRAITTDSVLDRGMMQDPSGACKEVSGCKSKLYKEEFKREAPGTFASGQDEVTRNWFTFLLETTKKQTKTDIIYELTIFKTLDIRKQKSMVSERWKADRVSLTVAPGYSLREIQRLRSRKGKPDRAS